MWIEAFPTDADVVAGIRFSTRLSFDEMEEPFRQAFAEAWEGEVPAEVEVHEVEDLLWNLLGAWCYCRDAEGLMVRVTMNPLPNGGWKCDDIADLVEETQQATVKFEGDRWWYLC